MKKSLLYLTVLLVIAAMAVSIIPNTRSAVSDIGSVKATSYSYYIDSLGYLVVVGEVENTGSNTIQMVGLTGTVTTSDGQTANSGTQAFVTNLIPHQKAPFYMEFMNAPTNDGTWYGTTISDISINVAQADATSQYTYPDLKIIDDHASVGTNKGTSGAKPTDSNYGDYGTYWVNGKVQNTGSKTAENVRVYAMFYNSTGTVVAIGYSEVTPSVNAGSSTSFKLGAFDMNQTIVPADKKIATYSLLIQASGPTLQGAAPSVAPTTQPSPAATLPPSDNNPTGNPTGSSGNNATTTTSDLWIYAVVIVVVIAVIVVALVIVRRRRAPSEPKVKQASGKHRKK